MKKILLVLVAFLATVPVSAQNEGWQKSFAPVANADDLAGVHTAVAGDGSVYTSSTYNQAFTVGDITVADPEGLTSSCILKFDKDGNAKWVVTLAGKCKIYAMTADADGTLYVAGSSSDEKVIATGTDGKHYEIVNPTKEEWGDIVVAGQSAFLIKISAGGVVENLTTIEPAGPEGVYSGEAFVRPSKLVLDNGILYVSCFYQGVVNSLGWEGRYVSYTDFDTFEVSYVGDIISAGLFYVSASDLSGQKGLANVFATTDADLLFDGLQCGPDAFDFVVYGGVPRVAFIGWGNVTLNSTNAGPQSFQFEMKENSNNEHALVLAAVNAPSNAIVFHAAPHDKIFASYNLVDATIAGDNCILGGTFYGNFPLDNTVTKEVNSSFVASIKMSDCSVNWAKANDEESQATCMIVTGEEIHASTDKATYVFKTANGELKSEQTMNQSFNDADCYNDKYVSTIYTNGTNVVVFSPKMNPSGIEAIKAAAKTGAAKIYNVNGVELSAPQKGLNIIKTAEGTKKMMK